MIRICDLRAVLTRTARFCCEVFLVNFAHSRTSGSVCLSICLRVVHSVSVFVVFWVVGAVVERLAEPIVGWEPTYSTVYSSILIGLICMRMYIAPEGTRVDWRDASGD